MPMKWPALRVIASIFLLASPGVAADLVIEPVTVTDWKAVYGRVETRDRVPARARLGGTLEELLVAEGDRVESGDQLGRVVDAKQDFQLRAIDAQIQAAQSRLENAEAELARGEELLQRGVTTVQRLDALRTQVDVLTNQIAAARADRQVLEQQVAEGACSRRWPAVRWMCRSHAGAVVTPGQTIATLGGGGFFLRLAVPERHAERLREGDDDPDRRPRTVPHRAGWRAIYPLIENGRVIADVEVEGLDDAFRRCAGAGAPAGRYAPGPDGAARRA